MGSLIATLRDDFANNTIDPAWETLIQGSATVTESGGQARCALPNATAGTHLGYYRSVGTYDLTGDGAYININTMVATGVAATAAFDLVLNNTNYYRWRQLSGTLTARKVVAGVDTQLYSVAWNATTYKYLRIRESAGTVYFDSSNNGTSWTNRATTTVSGDFAVTDLLIEFGAQCGNIASPGTLILDDYNLLSLSSNWRWVQGRREYNFRVGGITLAAPSGVAYIATAATVDSSGNLVSPRYFAGPQKSGRTLVEYSSQASAEAMAVNLPSVGRWDMPQGVYVEARYVRLYFRSSTGASFVIREFYPRRLVQSDDIEAESIVTLLLAAGAVTADKISVLQLSAITADMGNLTAGTITGATIRSAASGARWEGNSTRLYGTDGTNTQWEVLNSTGKLTAGAGNVLLDVNGLQILSQNSFFDGTNGITWYEGSVGGAVNGEIYAVLSGGQRSLYLNARSNAAGNQGGFAGLSGTGVSRSAFVTCKGNNVSGNDTTAKNTYFAYEHEFTGPTGMNLDIQGNVKADSPSAVGTNINSTVMLLLQGPGTTLGTFSLLARNSAAANHFYVRDDGQIGVNQAVTNFSDEAFKRDIADLDIGDGQLATLLTALKPKRYRMKDLPNDAPEQLGFVAQDWQKHPILNMLVREVVDGKLGIVQESLHPIYALLFRRLFARIAQLEARLP